MRPHKGHKHEKNDKLYDRHFNDCVRSIKNFEKLCEALIDDDLYYNLREEDLAQIERSIGKIAETIRKAAGREAAKRDD